jgi:cell division protein FtsQ
VPRATRIPPAVRQLPVPRGPALRRLVALSVLLALVLGAWSWLRDSSLVRISTVTVTGVSSSEGTAVRAALTRAARGMTTLHVRKDDLRAAVSGYSSVAAISTQKDFPHGLAIEVTERAPVALVEIAGERIPVGAGGRLMRGVKPRRPLPVLETNKLGPGGRLSDPQARSEVAILAAAPEVLRHRVAKVSKGTKGLTLDVRSGPQLFFGGTTRLRAKWMATARVLAEPSAQGAVYLDVRVPERVAAGGLGTLPENAADPLGSDPQVQP